jgi:hypothetical protein
VIRPRICWCQLSAPEQLCRLYQLCFLQVCPDPISFIRAAVYFSALLEQVELVSDQDRLPSRRCYSSWCRSSKGDLRRGFYHLNAWYDVFGKVTGGEEWCVEYERGLEFYALELPSLVLRVASPEDVQSLLLIPVKGSLYQATNTSRDCVALSLRCLCRSRKSFRIKNRRRNVSVC